MPYVDPNLTLQSVLLAKSHATSDPTVDPVPTPAADAMLCHTEVNPVQPDFEKVDPAYLTGSFTAQSSIIGRKIWTINPQIYLQGAEVEDVPPFWVCMVIACGAKLTYHAGVDPAPNTWDIDPLTEGCKPVAIYHHRSGILKKMLGCLGTCKMDFPAGQPVNMSFGMKGKYDVPTDVVFPAGTLVVPTGLARTVSDETLTIGAYTPRFTNITFDMAVTVSERRDGNSADAMYGLYISNRAPTVTITFEAEKTLAAGFNPWTKLGLFDDLAWIHGTATQNAAFTVNDAQLVQINEREQDRRMMLECMYKCRANTPDSEWKIVLTEPNPA